MLTLDLEKKGKVKEAKVDAMGSMSSPGPPSCGLCQHIVSSPGRSIGSVNSILYNPCLLWEIPIFIQENFNRVAHL